MARIGEPAAYAVRPVETAQRQIETVNLLVARVATIVGVLVLTPLLYLPLWVLMPTDAPAA